jgi:hypothetical protein
MTRCTSTTRLSDSDYEQAEQARIAGLLELYRLRSTASLRRTAAKGGTEGARLLAKQVLEEREKEFQAELAYVEAQVQAEMKAQQESACQEAVTTIARQVLGIPTLEARNSDRLDFHEIGVWSLRQALSEAYLAGRASRS